MTTIFTFNNNQTISPNSYTELYHDPEAWVVETAGARAYQPGLQKKKIPITDTVALYHVVNDKAPKMRRSNFTNFVQPVGVAWPGR